MDGSLLIARALVAETAVLAQVPVGEYVSIWKVIPPLLLLLVWGRFLTWVDKDAKAAFMPRVPINVGMIAGLIVGFLMFFILPGFAIAFTVLVVVALIEAGVYLAMRNQKIGLGDLGQQFNDWLRSFGGKPKEIVAPVGDVLIIRKDGSSIEAPAADAPDRPAYEAVQLLLTEPLRKGCERIDLVPGEGGWTSKYNVDGVNYAGPGFDKSRASAGIAFIKQAAGMDLNEKRKPQTGALKVSVDGKRREVEVQTAGSTVGEQLRAEVEPRHRHDLKLDQTGLTADQLEVVRGSAQDGSGGVVVVAAPKGQGLTTLMYAILRGHDAFLQHVMTVERDPEQDLEGITQNKLPGNANAAEEVKMVEWVTSQMPDVLMVSRVEDARSAVALAKFSAGENRRVYVGVRAANTFDALAAWRKLVGDDRLATKTLRMVISGRVVRRLCQACKVGYTPDPSTLRKLSMDPEKVGQLFQARKTPLRDPKGNVIPCEFCRELQFRGRVGVYEILQVDDEVRSVIQSGGSINQLKAAFRKQRGKYLQEMALAKVEEGETSVEEVLRVMKAGESQPRSAA